jgi:hypothetical protein
MGCFEYVSPGEGAIFLEGFTVTRPSGIAVIGAGPCGLSAAILVLGTSKSECLASLCLFGGVA